MFVSLDCSGFCARWPSIRVATQDIVHRLDQSDEFTRLATVLKTDVAAVAWTLDDAIESNLSRAGRGWVSNEDCGNHAKGVQDSIGVGDQPEAEENRKRDGLARGSGTDGCVLAQLRARPGVD